MEYVTGVSKKETVEISEILSGDFEGKQVKVNGAVHTIRDMGEVAFVILRKREGLLQCVFEEGKTKFDLKELKEASTIEVEGTVRAEHRAPNGFEVRLDTIRVLSEPAEQLPVCDFQVETANDVGDESGSPCDCVAQRQRAGEVPHPGGRGQRIP